MRLGQWVAWALVSLGAATSHAQSSVRLELEGTCPSESQVGAALAAEGVSVVPNSSLRVSIAPAPEETATLQVSRGAQSVTSRRLTSTDCIAIAEAFALIVANAARQQPVRAPALTAPAASSGASDTLAPQPISKRFTVGVIGGVSFIAGDRPAFAELEPAICKQWCLAARARVSQQAQLDEVMRADLSIGGALGRLISLNDVANDVWFRPTIGAVAVFSAVDSPGRSKVTRVHPALAAAVVVGVPLIPTLSVRAGLETLFFPLADRYLDGVEVLRISPRFQVLSSAGLEFHTDW